MAPMLKQYYWQTSNFYNRIRGPRGDTGKTGKLGSEGPRGIPGVKGEKGESLGCIQPARSCFHLHQRGENRSGIYTIRPADMSSTMEVFCDMESAGGGWTLVASVHENNLHGKCSVGDRWSSEQGEDGINPSGSSNWENYNTFGTAEGATSDDYKSGAYFNLPASDVMIWHVPNNIPISEASSRANLKYYTETGFIQDYGGNLGSLFRGHFPMRMGENKGEMSDEITRAVMEYNKSASAIQSLVPGFFHYAYDAGNTSYYIKDGGSDMFDDGNMVYYQIGDNPEKAINYNVHYRNSAEEVNVLSTTSHPFHVIMWIGNEQGTVPSFSLTVRSGIGADGEGRASSNEGSLSSGTLRLKYFSYNVYDANDPSITAVFYYILNTKWGSIAPKSFSKTPWTTGTDNLQHGVRVSGSPQSIVMGYMLLSKSDDTLVSDLEVQAVLTSTMNIFSRIKKGTETASVDKMQQTNKTAPDSFNDLESMFYNIFNDGYDGYDEYLYGEDPEHPVDDASMVDVTTLAAAFNNSAPSIRSLIPGFYSYTYDFNGRTQNYINDGGNDMFDNGNKLYYQIGDSPPTQVTYNVNYRNESQGIDLLATTSHPFNAMMWVGNEEREIPKFSLKVLSNAGADSDGYVRSGSGSLSYGNFQLRFQSYSVYDAGDPSITEVFYYIANPTSWQSTPPTSFSRSPWSSGTDSLSHGVQALGRPKSILMGYMLLSKAGGEEVTDPQIRAVLYKTMEIVSRFEKIDESSTAAVLQTAESPTAASVLKSDFSCNRLNESLVQPIIYLRGSNDSVMTEIPPIAKSFSTPGFIQFRSYTPTGIPNAFCPGVKTESCRPQSVCVGGINSIMQERRTCGDFAGWDGLPGDSPTATAPDGAAKATNDLNKSILIFTRKQT